MQGCGKIRVLDLIKERRPVVATASIGQIVHLDDDMADRIIESLKTANDRPFGQGSKTIRPATDEDMKRIAEATKRAFAK
jgi:hypothetical protein